MSRDGVDIELDELDVLVIVDNETDTLSSVHENIPQLSEIAHLLPRTPSNVLAGRECKVVFDQLCCACHGFSVLLTAHRDGVQHCMLVDVGPYAQLWLDNARRLGVDLAKIETIFLSHWHFDHSGALPTVLTAICRARVKAGLAPAAVDLHPNRPDHRGVLSLGGPMLMLPREPTFEDIANTGATVVTHDDPHSICDGFFFASGAIERVTEYETGLAGHHSFRGSVCEPDPLIWDERFVAAAVRDRGISVLSACSHAGIVNVCLAAQRRFQDLPVDVVLGGYHLAGKDPESRIEPTVRDLAARIAPRVVAPGHCTGWRAKTRLAETFAPTGRYAPSVVGSLYRLRAAR